MTMSNTVRPFHSNSVNDKNNELVTQSAIIDLRTSIDAAIAVMKTETFNRYFYVPQDLTTISTGQSDLLAMLKDVFLGGTGAVQDNQQRRFVINGLKGSSNTELCIKFAYENRDR